MVLGSGAPGVETDIPIKREGEQPAEVATKNETVKATVPVEVQQTVAAPETAATGDAEVAAQAAIEAAANPQASARVVDGVRPTGDATSTAAELVNNHDLTGMEAHLVSNNAGAEARSAVQAEEPPAAEVIPENQEDGTAVAPETQPITGGPPAIGVEPPAPGATQTPAATESAVGSASDPIAFSGATVVPPIEFPSQQTGQLPKAEEALPPQEPVIPEPQPEPAAPAPQELPPTAAPVIGPEGMQPAEDPKRYVDDFLAKDFQYLVEQNPTNPNINFIKADLESTKKHAQAMRDSSFTDELIAGWVKGQIKLLETAFGKGII
jgi:hypothetical protein